MELLEQDLGRSLPSSGFLWHATLGLYAVFLD